MRIILACAIAAAIGGPASAQEAAQAKTITATQYYALGQRFASCSARYTFVAAMATRAKQPNVATAAEAKAREWKAAGLALLLLGLEPPRQGETSETFDSLVRTKLIELGARFDRNPNAFNAAQSDELASECQKWEALQKRMVEMLQHFPN